jgi:hypothetical protein
MKAAIAPASEKIPKSVSCEPRLQAEHMAAPTNAANVKNTLANSEPSTQVAAANGLLDRGYRKPPQALEHCG